MGKDKALTHTSDTRGWWWQRSSLCRYYALIAAVVLVFLGIAAFESNSGSWAWTALAFRLGLAGIFAYTGLFVRDKEDVHDIIQGMGWLLVVIGGATLLSFWAVGDDPSWNPVGVRLFILGVISILACRYLRDRSPDQEEEQVS